MKEIDKLLHMNDIEQIELEWELLIEISHEMFHYVSVSAIGSWMLCHSGLRIRPDKEARVSKHEAKQECSRRQIWIKASRVK